MRLRESVSVEVLPRSAELNQAIESAPEGAGVLLLWPETGAPYFCRTGSLRRRMRRLLREPTTPSRLLNLRSLVHRIEYWLTGSRLESAVVAWEVVRRCFPEDYRQRLRLRMPPYVKMILSNRFPRTQVTSRLSVARSLFFGPFRTRTAAERFEDEFLDLFQVRRCPENFDPSPEHPGCIYGEMGRCLRPCQEVVGVEEYGSEVVRVSEFLSTGGESLLRPVAAARERSSDELDFEEAARQHQRYERIQQVLKLRDDLACNIDHLDGVAVVPSAEPETLDLWFALGGMWLPPSQFGLKVIEGKPVSLDRRLREIVSNLERPKSSVIERQEHLAILSRWYYSSWCDGEWLPFDGVEAIPYRKLVNAIHRVARRA